MQKQDLLEKLKNSYPEIIIRSDLSKMEPRIVSSGRMANEDSRGTGPEGLFYIGRRACYTRDNFITWVEKRITFPKARQ